MTKITRRGLIAGSAMTMMTSPLSQAVARALNDPLPTIGFGAQALGGENGRVIEITSRAESGVGSLRWALEDLAEPRIILLKTRGEIKLTREIRITHPYVTLDGSTADIDGTTISGARLLIDTHDVILTGLQLRPGDSLEGDIPNRRDALSFTGRARDVLILGNSLTWALDENLSIWGPARNVTIAYNIIGEALRDSLHVDEGATEPAPHSMGLIVGSKIAAESPENITIARNLFVSNDFRNPFIKSCRGVEIVGNLIVNFGAGHQAIAIGGEQLSATAVLSNNVFWPGIDTRPDERPPVDLRGLGPGSVVYIGTNLLGRDALIDGALIAHGELGKVSQTAPFAQTDADTLSVAEIAQHVLEHAGAKSLSGAARPEDVRVINGVRQGQSRIVDSVSQARKN